MRRKNPKPDSRQNQKQSHIPRLLPGLLLAGAFAVCSVRAISFGGPPSWMAGTPEGSASDQTSQTAHKTAGSGGSTSSQTSLAPCKTSDSSGSVFGQTSLTAYETTTSDGSAASQTAFLEHFKSYEAFGMIYDAQKDELWYQGKLVRWFEDYYPVGDDGQSGTDFFCENGVVDVHAIRDFSVLTQNEDGSFDPSGRLIGLTEFSSSEFAARDINAINNPVACTLAGDPPSEEELRETAAEYAAFGLTFDAETKLWYWNGEKVRYFLDILTSNEEPLNGGHFRGSMRKWWQDGGTVDLYTTRDFGTPDENGNGQLIGLEKYSQQEYDIHTDWNQPTKESSGECIVVSE